MSFAAFRTWLETEYVSPITRRPLGHDAPSDYTSRLRTLSRLLGVEIESQAPETLESLADTFGSDARIATEQTPKAIIDMRVALRRYAMFKRIRASDETPNAHGDYAAQLATDFQTHGFVLTRARRHTLELKSGEIVVYLKRLSATLPIVVGPELEADFSQLASLSGVISAEPFGYYHNSQMPAFPRRTNRGRTPIHYGLDFGVEGPAALRWFALALLDRSHLAPSDADRAEQNTETTRLQKARVGQGQFRADLFDAWEACPLTGISTPDLVRASHIKPWKDCSPRERLDPNNGILLAVHMDCLFDKGLISFTDDGYLLISPRLSQHERTIFALRSPPPRIKVKPAQARYLRHHRENVYLCLSSD